MENGSTKLNSEMNLKSPVGFDFSSIGLSIEQLDSNPRFQGVLASNGCTDNSNFTAQRPSACLSCS